MESHSYLNDLSNLIILLFFININLFKEWDLLQRVFLVSKVDNIWMMLNHKNSNYIKII
jgi:hypothetical protein